MTKLLTKDKIWEKNLCRDCNVHICHNNHKFCPYQYNPNAHLCLTCKDLNNEIVDDQLKCYHTCKHRKNKKKSKQDVSYWLS